MCIFKFKRGIMFPVCSNVPLDALGSTDSNNCNLFPIKQADKENQNVSCSANISQETLIGMLSIMAIDVKKEEILSLTEQHCELVLKWMINSNYISKIIYDNIWKHTDELKTRSAKIQELFDTIVNEDKNLAEMIKAKRIEDIALIARTIFRSFFEKEYSQCWQDDGLKERICKELKIPLSSNVFKCITHSPLLDWNPKCNMELLARDWINTAGGLCQRTTDIRNFFARHGWENVRIELDYLYV